MTTRFDIGENVYLEAKIDRIDIDTKGTISYHIRLAADGTVVWVDEDKLHKTPANDVEKEMLKTEAKK